MDAWSRLDRTTQFRIAVDVATRRGAALARQHASVLSVGAGLRSCDRSRFPSDEVCLRFLVGRKWKTRRAGGVPARIVAVARLGGRRVRLDIPTDVSEFGGGSPHAFVDLSGGIASRNAGRPVDHGAACCMVHNPAMPGERYLLSCYHVFSPSLSDAPSSALDCVGPLGSPLGQVLEVANPDAPSGGLDAALVLLDDPTLDSLPTWGQVPRRRATDVDIGRLAEAGPLSICARRVAPAIDPGDAVTRSGPLPAAFQSYFPHPLPFDYRATAGRFLSIAGTLQYVSPVLPGDSGSAVLDGAGVLFGMHFFGMGNGGFAMSAPRLFAPGVFSIELEL
jgi:hypothetical protein